jgi:hypothetical protein
VQDATRKLIDAQPLLGGLAADPSLHGIATTLTTLAKGAASGRQRPRAWPNRWAALPTRLTRACRAPGVFFVERLFSDGKLAAPPAAC